MVARYDFYVNKPEIRPLAHVRCRKIGDCVVFEEVFYLWDHTLCQMVIEEC